MHAYTQDVGRIQGLRYFLGMTTPYSYHRVDEADVDLSSVTVRRHPTARRLTLRVDQVTGDAWVSAPPQVSERDIVHFVRRYANWLADRRARVPDRVPLADGAVVPLMGLPHQVRHVGAQPGSPPVEWANGELRVSGAAEFVARRLTDFLKAEARRRLSELSMEKAARIGRVPARVSVRDTRTRWGSCSHTGRLTYCWRLILAPEVVQDYVAAHEVAHLAEMHHGPAFWQLCDALADDMTTGQDRLKLHGASLRRYG